MINKLKEVKERYKDIETSLALPETLSDNERYKKLMREYKELTPLMEEFESYEKTAVEMEDAASLMESESDAEMRAMAQEEYYLLRDKLRESEQKLKILLLPKDPNDEKDVAVEIRAGAGGEEAALFAAVLYRMYSMYADRKGFKTEVMSQNETELGGFKEITFTVSGAGAYSRFKFESGVHRVQRVPETESSGRIQTSTATVAVLPEVEDVSVELDPKDLEIETCKSSGAGGQHINKTESAIRIIHKPTGIVVECQDERSQFKNKDKAMKLLRAKLYDMKQREQNEKIAGERRSQVGTGDRSERIRTYNFREGRVSDHRIGLTLYTLDSIINGDIDALIDALSAADTAEKLRGGDSL
ncbi:MAG: peptide chain release factor 1 [Candidatus Avispirillum sp.]